MTDEVFKSYQDMMEYYNHVEGFKFITYLKEDQYRATGLKAHVVREHLDEVHPMRYVPLEGKHYFMFKSEVAMKQFKQLAGI